MALCWGCMIVEGFVLCDVWKGSHDLLSGSPIFLLSLFVSLEFKLR